MAPHFLKRLGLEHDADERAIRRAYARELKKIDQETEAEAFQSLRASYEAALDWARARVAVGDDSVRREYGAEAEITVNQDAETAPVPDAGPTYSWSSVSWANPSWSATLDANEARLDQGRAGDSQKDSACAEPSAAPQVDAYIQDFDPREDADEVYSHFLESFIALNRTSIPDVDLVVAQLKEHLSSERLLNVRAREIFEFRCAARLAEGWKPGHEVLFAACGQTFAWDTDRRLSQRLGAPGEMMEQAQHERALFDSQPAPTRKALRLPIQLLRHPDEPTDRQLGSCIATLEQLVAVFPSWMRIITDVERIEHWKMRWQALLTCSPEIVRR